MTKLTGNRASFLRSKMGQLASSAAALKEKLLPAAQTLPDVEEDVLVVDRVSRVPDGQCVYAIGDIHGRLDLLEILIGGIVADAQETLAHGTTVTLVFLGDYIDRGLQSRAVIDYFLSDALQGFETIFLKGNHEEALLNFYEDPTFGAKWAQYGGAETLFSYGLQPPPAGRGDATFASLDEKEAHDNAWGRLWDAFRQGLPPEHLAFYRDLKSIESIGDYTFVHAGLRPGLALEDQSEQDMLWIREEFLYDTDSFDQVVVHGHTPEDDVYRDNRRIGLDTGAYLSGRLSAVRLFSDDVRFLTT